ncbi:MAG: DUF3262 family protein [Pseudomonadales bacterium]
MEGGSEAFKLATGFLASDLRLIFYSAMGAGGLFWASYVVKGSFQQYKDGEIKLANFSSVFVQTLVLMSIWLWLLNIL